MMEYRYAELRADGRRLEGDAIRYGDRAQLGAFEERFEPGAFAGSLGDVMLNLQHDRSRPLARTGGGGLEVRDTAHALELRADLPPTRDADDALTLVRAGVLRGLSIEFEALRERWDAAVRVVERARLYAVGLVDRPAYPQSAVSARQSPQGARVSGSLTYGAALVVGTPDGQRQAATKEMWTPGAFAYAVNDDSREINLLFGDYSQPLASKQAGTLTLTDLESGLIFDAPVPDTSWGRDMLAASASGAAVYRAMPRFTIPPIADAVTYTEEPGTGAVVRHVNLAVLSAIAVVTRAPRAAPPSDPEADPVYGAASTLAFEDGGRSDRNDQTLRRRRKVII